MSTVVCQPLGSYHFLAGWGPSACDRGSAIFSAPRLGNAGPPTLPTGNNSGSPPLALENKF